MPTPLLDNSPLVVIHQKQAHTLAPMMAGQHKAKNQKVAKIEGPNCKKLLVTLPIKGRAENSAQIKAKTQPNAAKISAPNSSPKSLKTVCKISQNRVNFRVKSSLECNRVLCEQPR